MPIDARQSDKKSEISRKHGNTLVRTLRKTYGTQFAEGCSDDEKLSHVLHRMDAPSRSTLLYDHQQGWLEEICGA